MEAVKAFQAELSSLYEMRPPVSKAKMASITKSAVKAIKFYKHVVQSVEKFIQKCKPEFKVPGLYVVDSIVRQSRHQFSAEKDVFGPRFMKNVCGTFQNLLKCPKDDLEKIKRVLVLWQKNTVFPSDVLQSLLDWVNDPSNLALQEKAREAVSSHGGEGPPSRHKTKEHLEPYQPGDGDNLEMNGADDQQDSQVSSSGSEVVAKVTKLLLQIQKSLQSGPQTNALVELRRLQEVVNKHGNLLAGLDPSLLTQIQTVIASLMEVCRKEQNVTDGGNKKDHHHKHAAKSKDGSFNKKDEVNASNASFNKKLLDYDYGDSEEESGGHESDGMDISEDDDAQDSSTRGPTPVLAQPDLLQRIEEISKTLQRTEQLGRLQQEREQREKKQSLQGGPVPPQLPPPLPGLVPPFPPPSNFPQSGQPPPLLTGPPFSQFPGPPPPLLTSLPPPLLGPDPKSSSSSRSQNVKPQSRRYRSRSRSRSRTKSRSRSRSRSNDRRRGSRRYSRSRSRSNSRERRQRSERRRRGLPPVRENYVSIASTTVWVGHLSKHTRENELKQHCEEATHGGQVFSINLITPRGCAYVTFSERKDAQLAIEELQGVKICGFAARVEWAQGNGVKGDEFKEAWDKKIGVTYIPFDQVGEFDLLRLSEGGVVDEDSLPEGIREKFIADFEKMQEEKRIAEELAEERARVEAQERANAVAASRRPNEEEHQTFEEGFRGGGRGFRGGFRGRGFGERGRGGFRGGRGGGQNSHVPSQGGEQISVQSEEPSQIRLTAELPILSSPQIQQTGPSLLQAAFGTPTQPTLLPLMAQQNQATISQPPALFATAMQGPSPVAPPRLAGLAGIPGLPQQLSQPQQQASPANTRPTGPGLLAVQQAIAAGSLSAEQQQSILGEKDQNQIPQQPHQENRPSSLEAFIQQQQLLPPNLASGAPILLRLPGAGQNPGGLPMIDVVTAMAQLRQQAEARQQFAAVQQQQAQQQAQVQQLIQRIQMQQQQEGQLNFMRQLQAQQQAQNQQPQPGEDDADIEAEEAYRQMIAEEEAEEQQKQASSSIQPGQAIDLQRVLQIAQGGGGQQPQDSQPPTWPPHQTDSPNSSSSQNSSQPPQPSPFAGIHLPPGFPQIAIQGRPPFAAGSPLVGFPGAERLQLPPGFQLQFPGGGGIQLLRPGGGGAGGGFPPSAAALPQRLGGPAANLNQILAAFRTSASLQPGSNPASGQGLFLRPQGLPPGFQATLRGMVPPQFLRGPFPGADPSAEMNNDNNTNL